MLLRTLRQLIFPESDCVEAAWLVINLLGLNITKSTLTESLLLHPDFPSMLSVSDVFEQFGIASLSLRIKPHDLETLPLPLLVQQVDNGHTRFSVVKSIEHDSVVFYDYQQRLWHKADTADFMESFTGIVLAVEPDEQAGEPAYGDARKKEKLSRLLKYTAGLFIPLAVLVFVAVNIFTIGIPGIWVSLSAISSLSGLFICFLLLWHEVDSSNMLLKKVCAATGNNGSCSEVLSSSRAKIFGISWSTIGFSYFFGNLIMLLTASGTPGIPTLVFWGAIAASPFIIYSLSLQALMLKKWCTLCLYTLLILTIHAIIGFLGTANLSSVPHIGPALLLTVAISYLLPLFLVSFIIPFISHAQQGRNRAIELQRLKHDPQIFEALLMRQKQVNAQKENFGIYLGNPDGKIKIIKVCNPYCGPCADAHKPLAQLLANNNQIQLQIIFTTSSHESDKGRLPVSQLLAISETGNEQQISDAIHNWYTIGAADYENFAQKMPVLEPLDRQHQKIEAMSQWCHHNQISFTPTLFINGNQLPDMYTVSDLKYFLST
jgi:uncharacterized membrane protein